MTDEEYAAAIEGTREERDIVIKQVAGGYMLQGVQRFVELTSGALRVSKTTEAIAQLPVVSAVVEHFLNGGSLASFWHRS